MKTFLGAFLVGICINFAAAQDLRTPAEKYQEYLKAYRDASGAFRMAETDQQRKNAVEQLDKFPSKFLDLSDKNPADPVALQALRQAVQAVIS